MTALMSRTLHSRLGRASASLAVLASMASAPLPAVASAQHGGGGPPLVTKSPTEASQYDFLLGQWDLTVKPQASGLAQRIHGGPKLQGTWKGWRAIDGWGVEDELRIVDASGNPLALTHFVRVYDATAKHWKVAAVEAYRGRITTSSAEWKGTEMVASSEGTDEEGKAFISRTRIFALTPTSFTYRSDRSFDGGKKWEEGILTIEARRVSASAPR
ncbi:MAG: hypothetical protein ACHQQ3_12470 [Gemmatimonadales bacterium]